MFRVRNFRELIPYKKAINILTEMLKEDLAGEDIKDIRFAVTKICGYIAQSQGSSLYKNESKKHLTKALKWTTILDKKIRELNLEDEKKKKYKNEVLQIRRILISFRNKLEENVNE